ncbi:TRANSCRIPTION FACTOR NF-Y ALPHA-RELATED [Ceraceosorus bombacis]|uniref:Transcriptional activator HAP2 n=1 Tax=Ceraceosorus bombacis TaxID=401625 RepID=A0A0P1BCA2_9BASI|nr:TRANSCRIPTION FACTOR NF-Y ALPHA-RELATED [Ceraceosorus bombacis]
MLFGPTCFVSRHKHCNLKTAGFFLEEERHIRRPADSMAMQAHQSPFYPHSPVNTTHTQNGGGEGEHAIGQAGPGPGTRSLAMQMHHSGDRLGHTAGYDDHFHRGSSIANNGHFGTAFGAGAGGVTAASSPAFYISHSNSGGNFGPASTIAGPSASSYMPDYESHHSHHQAHTPGSSALWNSSGFDHDPHRPPESYVDYQHPAGSLQGTHPSGMSTYYSSPYGGPLGEGVSPYSHQQAASAPLYNGAADSAGTLPFMFDDQDDSAGGGTVRPKARRGPAKRRKLAESNERHVGGDPKSSKSLAVRAGVSSGDLARSLVHSWLEQGGGPGSPIGGANVQRSGARRADVGLGETLYTDDAAKTSTLLEGDELDQHVTSDPLSGFDMSASHLDGADDESLRVRDAAHRDVDTLYKGNLGDHSLDPAKGLVGEADGAHLDAKSTVPAGDGIADEEPLYVNAKQYQRILKRRAARQRIERKRRIDIARTTLKNAKDAGEMDLSSFDLTKVSFSTNQCSAAPSQTSSLRRPASLLTLCHV